MHEQRSCSASSTLHQFCTPWQQLTPTTWHAGGQLSRRPIRWLAEEQSRLLNRRLCASAVGPDHLLASGAKDRAGGRLSRAPRAHRQLLPFALPISPRNATYLRVSLTRMRIHSHHSHRSEHAPIGARVPPFARSRTAHVRVPHASPERAPSSASTPSHAQKCPQTPTQRTRLSSTRLIPLQLLLSQ